MPPKKYKKAKRTKRAPARRPGSKSNHNGSLSISAPRRIGGVADELDVVLRYEETVSLTTTSGTSYYVFRGNDTFDPNFTGTGSQPVYFDNWAALYSTQQVVRSSICVEPLYQSGTESSPTSYALAPSPISSSSSMEALVALPKSRYTSGVYYQVPKKIRSVADTAQILSMAVVRGQGLGAALVSASPGTTGTWFWIFAQKTTDASSSTTVKYRVTIDYHVHFSERVPAGLSLSHQQYNLAAFRKIQAAKPQGPVYFECKEEVADARAPRAIDNVSEIKTTISEGKGDTKSSVVKLTPEEAFEDWGDVDSEYAVFKAQLTRKRKLMALAKSPVVAGASAGPVLPKEENKKPTAKPPA